jgi:hypothetical protein
MFNIFSHKGNANYNYIEIPSRPSKNGYQQNKNTARHQWLTPALLLTWEARLGGSQFQARLGKKFTRPNLQNTRENELEV